MNEPDVTEQPESANAGCVQRVVSWITGNTRKSARRAAAKKVKQAFDGVDWGKQIFHVNHQTIDVGGETKFYKAGEIDAAITRLNAVLRDLSS